MNDKDKTKSSNTPTGVYHVRDYTGVDGEPQSAWTRIGSVWMHRDGDGYNIHLDCLPVDGRLTLRGEKPS